MGEYVFASRPEEEERARLVLVERACDETTRRWIKRAGIGPGRRCLEVGAGAGSILRWMAGQAGPSGAVTGVDRSLRHLEADPAGNETRFEGDVLDLPPGAPFDVAHVRYVLVHNPSPERILRKLRDLLSPGGAAVVEEPDFSAARPPAGDSEGAHARVNAAILRMFRDKGLDPATGARLPELAEAAGLRVEAVETEPHDEPGTGPVAAVMGASARALKAAYVGTGEADETDVDAYARNAGDPNVRCVFYATVRTLLRRT